MKESYEGFSEEVIGNSRGIISIVSLPYKWQEILSKLLDAPSEKLGGTLPALRCTILGTPIGPLISLSDDTALYFLEFFEWQGWERAMVRLKVLTNAMILPGETRITSLISQELEAYFEGTLREFKTHFRFFGTPFQKRAWEALRKIPYGETRSYAQQAESVGLSAAYRAIANANGANRLAILIPCHRVIRNTGDYGGYGGGMERKKWLLEHERNTVNNLKSSFCFLK